jgi:hypothetical protein
MNVAHPHMPLYCSQFSQGIWLLFSLIHPAGFIFQTTLLDNLISNNETVKQRYSKTHAHPNKTSYLFLAQVTHSSVHRI